MANSWDAYVELPPENDPNYANVVNMLNSYVATDAGKAWLSQLEATQKYFTDRGDDYQKVVITVDAVKKNAAGEPVLQESGQAEMLETGFSLSKNNGKYTPTININSASTTGIINDQGEIYLLQPFDPAVLAHEGAHATDQSHIEAKISLYESIDLLKQVNAVEPYAKGKALEAGGTINGEPPTEIQQAILNDSKNYAYYLEAAKEQVEKAEELVKQSRYETEKKAILAENEMLPPGAQRANNAYSMAFNLSQINAVDGDGDHHIDPDKLQEFKIIALEKVAELTAINPAFQNDTIGAITNVEEAINWQNKPLDIKLDPKGFVPRTNESPRPGGHGSSGPSGSLGGDSGWIDVGTGSLGTHWVGGNGTGFGSSFGDYTNGSGDGKTSWNGYNGTIEEMIDKNRGGKKHKQQENIPIIKQRTASTTEMEVSTQSAGAVAESPAAPVAPEAQPAKQLGNSVVTPSVPAVQLNPDLLKGLDLASLRLPGMGVVDSFKSGDDIAPGAAMGSLTRNRGHGGLA